ncbi:MAG: DUF1570 domain-containing protein [Novosphingobium sp.]
MRAVFVALFLLLAPGAAHAEWLQTSSAHFVIYSEDSLGNARKFSERLERYHSALELVTGTKFVAPSPSNRVTIYVVDNQQQVRRLAGAKSRYLAGFYIPRAGASMAIIPRVSSGSGTDLDFSMITLLHEYAHHFMYSSSNFQMPRWYAEGGAEFFSSARFDNKGGVGLGMPAQHRAAELFYASDVTATDLLDPEEYQRRRGKSSGYDAYYGKSWLMFHYLVFEQKRASQLQTYLRLISTGKSLREAGLEAFGDFAVLERELDAYLRRSRVTYFNLPPSMLQTGSIEVRKLTPGEAAILPVRMQSHRGVDKEQAAEVVASAREIAGRFPADAAVQTALAEAEFDFGNDDATVAAADAALKLDPKQANAYVQKGYALFRQAETSSSPDAFTKARAPFVALNHIENDHPLPLLYFYLSFVKQGLKPTPLAVQGLERASELAPFDLGLRMTVAMQEIRDRRFDRARQNLAPIAYNPHGGSLAESAQKVIDRLDANPDWDGSDVAVDGNLEGDKEDEGS